MRVFAFLLFFSIQLVAQNNENSTKKRVTYSQQPKLTWESFKGFMPSNTDFAASVNTGIGFKWSYSTNQNKIDLQYEVESYVQPYFSWVDENEKDVELLKHEQLHFDITELFARKFRKRLDEYEFGRNIRKAMQKIHGDIEFERIQMQEAYDSETAHSKNEEQQLIWELKIAKLLKDFEAYSE
ncbi:DUF922 domain-containing protein [Aquimarina agarivorans]|uniref:DUF922 domain-containing protein n=1 Tax=Aquimarina agarivorans TaxID=980584 RepID=UPI000248EAB9|nr:hypothetical protein [Aquimarina agarivorans]